MPVSVTAPSNTYYDRTSTARPGGARKSGPVDPQPLSRLGADKHTLTPRRPPLPASKSTRQVPSIQDRIQSLQARSFGPPDRARAALENERNGIDRETVRQLMQLARSGDLKAGLALFKASNASADLVYRGTRLSDLLRSRPDSQERADWLAALAGGTRSRRAPSSAARQAVEPRREATRRRVEPSASKAPPGAASTVAGGAVVAAAIRPRGKAPDAPAVPGQSRGAPPSRVASMPPAKPPHPVGQTERIRTLRQLLAEDMSVYIGKGKMGKAWQLWVGLGQPLWIGNYPLLQLLHRLYMEVGVTTARNPRDFVGFVAAVEQQQHAVGGLPPADAPCGKAVAWSNAPAQLQELSLLESAP